MGDMGVTAHEAIPSLVSAVSGSERSVHLDAIEALGKLGSTDNSVIQVLTGALDDPDARRAAAKALGLLEAEDAVPDLIELLGDRDWVRVTKIIDGIPLNSDHMI